MLGIGDGREGGALRPDSGLHFQILIAAAVLGMTAHSITHLPTLLRLVSFHFIFRTEFLLFLAVSFTGNPLRSFTYLGLDRL